MLGSFVSREIGERVSVNEGDVPWFVDAELNLATEILLQCCVIAVAALSDVCHELLAFGEAEELGGRAEGAEEGDVVEVVA